MEDGKRAGSDEVVGILVSFLLFGWYVQLCNYKKQNAFDVTKMMN